MPRHAPCGDKKQMDSIVELENFINYLREIDVMYSMLVDYGEVNLYIMMQTVYRFFDCKNYSMVYDIFEHKFDGNFDIITSWHQKDMENKGIRFFCREQILSILLEQLKTNRDQYL